MQASETEEEGMKRMKTMKDMMRKIGAKDRMDANSSWWVSGLLAADCKKKAWLHPEWEDTMERWCNWLFDFFHSCSDGVKIEETQSPALVCDRAAAGSDPVHTGLPPVRGRFASANSRTASSSAAKSRSKAPHDQVCRRRNRSFAQNNETDCLEMRNAEVGEEDAKPLARCEEKGENGPSIGSATRRCKI